MDAKHQYSKRQLLTFTCAKKTGNNAELKLSYSTQYLLSRLCNDEKSSLSCCPQRSVAASEQVAKLARRMLRDAVAAAALGGWPAST